MSDDYEKLVTALRPVFFAPPGDENAFRKAIEEAFDRAIDRGLLAAAIKQRALPTPPVVIDHLLTRLRGLIPPDARPDVKAAIDATLERVDGVIHYPQRLPNQRTERPR